MPYEETLPIVADEEEKTPSVRDYIAERLAKRNDELKTLQAKEADNRGMLGLAQGVGQAIAGLSRAGDSYNPAPYKALEENAKAPVTDFLQQQQARAQGLNELSNERKVNREMALDDNQSMPSSVARNQARALISSVGGDPSMVTDDMSASDVGYMKDPIELMARLKSHRDEVALRNQELALKRREAANSQADKYIQALKKDLDADAARTGNFGQISNTVIQAQKLRKLAEDFEGSPRNLNNTQMEELAIGLARMLGGGQATDAKTAALVPQSAVGNFEKMKQWLMNEPTGTNQQKFVQNMLETIRREEDLANGQLNEIRSRRLPAHAMAKKSAPELYNQVVSSYGIDPNTGAPLKASHQQEKKEGEFPRQVRKDGQVATVSNETELKEAQSEGWQ